MATILEECEVMTARSVKTPGSADTVENDLREEEQEMEGREKSRYRAVAARLNYLAADRPDVQFTSKCICKHMSNPRIKDWENFKRAARYLKGRPGAVILHPFGEAEEELHAAKARV